MIGALSLSLFMIWMTWADIFDYSQGSFVDDLDVSLHLSVYVSACDVCAFVAISMFTGFCPSFKIVISSGIFSLLLFI